MTVENELIAAATTDQPAAQAALAAGLATEPAHAYLFAGPRGTGKTEAARAFAAELLADGAPDETSARRRALADPSPHPDLVWVSPPGNQHLVEEIRESVIAQVGFHPFEGSRRVFVIEGADAMAEESQNALLKTLEEPPSFTHLLLLAAEPAELLDTVRSRCQEVHFAALTPEAIERRLAADGVAAADPATMTAVARLAGGDLERARFLISERGIALRAAAEDCARAARRGELADAPWAALLKIAELAGGEEGERTEAALIARAEAGGDEKVAKRLGREAVDAGRRMARRRRTELLDLGLALVGVWYRDLIAHAEGAPEIAANSDRAEALGSDREGVDPTALRAALRATESTRRTLRVNVSEELALEALFQRVAGLLCETGSLL